MSIDVCKTLRWCVCKTLIKINPVLRNSILTGEHAECMQAACTAVKMKLVRTSFDWSYQVVLIHLPISAYFFTSFILPPFTPCAISDSCFFLHQRLLYPQMGKFKSHLCHVKNLHVDLSKFEVTETQKRCRIFFMKRRKYITFLKPIFLVISNVDGLKGSGPSKRRT